MTNDCDDRKVNPLALVLCTSPDGWSLHAPDSTDEAIASGDAPYIADGPGRPNAADYERATKLFQRRQRSA